MKCLIHNVELICHCPVCCDPLRSNGMQTAIESPLKQQQNRHREFQADYQSAFQFTNGVPAPWNGKEAKRLSEWLKANPTITRDQWRTILQNRSRSPIPQAEPLSRWVDLALNWLNGLADRWGNAATSNGGKFSKTAQNMEVLRQSLGRRDFDFNEEVMAMVRGARNGSRRLF